MRARHCAQRGCVFQSASPPELCPECGNPFHELELDAPPDAAGDDELEAEAELEASPPSKPRRRR